MRDPITPPDDPLPVQRSPDHDPLLVPDFIRDKGLPYSQWLARERAAGRPTRPGPQAHNAGITPGHEHRAPRPGDRRRATRGDLRRFARRLFRELIRRITAEADATGSILGDILDRLERLERRAG